MSWGVSQYDDNPFAETRDTRPSIPPSNAATAPPPWLQDTPEQDTAKLTSTASAPPNQSGDRISEDTKTAIPTYMLYTRVINLGLSIAMIVACALSLMTTASISTGVLACYVIVFACLLCCYEAHLKQISKIIALNFGFMYTAKYRCVFILFVGIILFNFSLFGKIIGCLMIANGCYNLFIIIKHPEFEEMQRKDAQAEIQDFLATNPAFAESILSAGASLAAKNPVILKKGAEAYVKANTTAPSSDV